jgi:hypothetical protein
MVPGILNIVTRLSGELHAPAAIPSTEQPQCSTDRRIFQPNS